MIILRNNSHGEIVRVCVGIFTTALRNIDRDSHCFTLNSQWANRDNGIEIPEAWIPTIRKHNGRPVRQQTAEGTTWAWSQTSQKTRTNRNNGDRNPAIVLDRQGTNGNS